MGGNGLSINSRDENRDLPRPHCTGKYEQVQARVRAAVAFIRLSWRIVNRANVSHKRDGERYYPIIRKS